MRTVAAVAAHVVRFLVHSRWASAAAALAIGVWAFGFGAQQMTPHWQERDFYQYEMGPALMVACGHGLRREPADPAIAAFLALERQTLDCAPIAAEPLAAKLNPFQSAHRYLLRTIGLAWKWYGVDWRVADGVVLALYALSCALAFLLLRVFLPLLWSAAGAWLYATAGTHLLYLGALRDYAKAPFVLAALWSLAWLLKRRRSPIQVLMAASLMGCALGVGLGFRMDLLVFVPFAVGMLLVFYPAPMREAWRERWLAVAALVLCAYVCAYPVLSAMDGRSNTAHVILLGLSREFGDLLGLLSLDYQFSNHYNDAFQQLQVDTLAGLRGHGQHLDYATPDYERFGFELLAEYARYFPADLWARVMAATWQTLRYDFLLSVNWAGGAVLFVALAVLALGWRSPRIGLAMLAAIAFLCAYPVLQFHLRHFFHLSIVPILCAGIVAYGLCAAWVHEPPGRRWRWLQEKLASRWTLTAALLTLALPLLVWSSLWAVQQHQQAQLLSLARSLPVQWLDRSAAAGPALLAPTQLSPAWQQRLRPDTPTDGKTVRVGYFWVLDVDPARPGCSAQAVRGALRYRASEPFFDFSRSFAYDAGRPVRLFVPAAELRHRIGLVSTHSTLEAMVLDADSWACVSRAGVAAPDVSLPLLLDLAAPAEVDGLRASVPAGLSDPAPKLRTFAVAPKLPIAAELRFLALPDVATPLPLSPGELLGSAGLQHLPGGLRMHGPVADRYSYLVRTDAVHFEPGDVLRVGGNLQQGGLSVGLVKDAAWAHQLPVLQPGDFDLFFAPEPGDYHVVIANHVAKPRALNVFDITRFGLVRQAH